MSLDSDDRCQIDERPLAGAALVRGYAEQRDVAGDVSTPDDPSAPTTAISPSQADRRIATR